MLKTINIQNFRGFKNIYCNDFSNINLIVGKNNVGKTAFLEALYLFFGRQNPLLGMKINADRGLGSVKIGTGSNVESSLNALFYNFNSLNLIKIVCDDGKKEISLQISIDKPISSEESQNNYQGHDTILKIKDSKFFQALTFQNSDDKEPFQLLITNQGFKIDKPGFFANTAYYINSRANLDLKERAELFTVLDTIGKTDEIVEALQQIEPRLKRLSIGIIADEPIIMGNIGTDRLIPLPLMGDGMVRLLDILIRIINFKDGALIIDEIENGIHHSAQEKIWKVIGTSALKYNVQIFASTHSMECLRNAYLALSEMQTDILRIHKVERVNEDIRIKTYDSEKLQTVFELNLEVR
jgi:AAA15 family ATPase/GTPase